MFYGSYSGPLGTGGGMRILSALMVILRHRVWTSIAERDLHMYKSDPVHIVTYNKPQSVLTAFNCTASVTVNAGHEQRHSLAGVALYIGAVNWASCVAVWPRPMMQLQRRDETGRDDGGIYSAPALAGQDAIEFVADADVDAPPPAASLRRTSGCDDATVPFIDVCEPPVCRFCELHRSALTVVCRAHATQTSSVC